MRTLLAIAAALVTVGCAATPPPGVDRVAVSEARAPVTILISIDGFRPDYLQRGVTPTLSQLAAEGVQAAMRPSFPSKTFPNHWATVTGLRPDRNGIVANKMEDTRRPGEVFTMASDDPFWWNGGTPIWADAEKAGIRTATMFWPGANVAAGGTKATAWPYDISGGTRPHDWVQFNQAVSDEQRVNTVIDWMRRPAAIRPRFVTLYFDTVDTAGHQFGPDDARTTRAVAEVDANIGLLTHELAALGQPANLVIVADHGMAATSSARTIVLDTIATPTDYRVIETGPYATLDAQPGRAAALEASLFRKHPHVQCWRKTELPARFHYGRNPRVPPYLCMAESGWTIAERAPTANFTGGNHGYDNDDPDMRALFIAHGPAFAPGRTLPTFDNVDVYPLVRDLLGMPAATGIDGSASPFRDVIKR